MSHIYRRLRYGRQIVVVSGLPRSGTSMMMQMLEAGGFPILTDEARKADESNPRGYYELERVKELDRAGDVSWLRDARGRAIKVIAYLLGFLPETFNYRVLFMQRHLDEILASQAGMLAARGEPAGGDDAEMRRTLERHLAETDTLFAGRDCFQMLRVGYADVLAAPEREARRVRDFLTNRLDPARMASVVDPELYRNRTQPA